MTKRLITNVAQALKNRPSQTASAQVYFAAAHSFHSRTESRPTFHHDRCQLLLSRRSLPQHSVGHRQERSMASQKQAKSAKSGKTLSVPRPSSSVIVVSPRNEILLLHRVQSSSSFPSAHVFPGGNLSADQDGEIPAPDSPERHVDSHAYRMAAIRETFEESGIVLARNNGFGRLIEVPDQEREDGRKAVHSNKVKFETWLASKGGRADVEGLIPFTRWITPTNVPKRFTTQMYIYFLPLENEELTSNIENKASNSTGASIPPPKSDGGLEHTTAQFKPAMKWVELAQANKIILFPPQLLLLQEVGNFLATPDGPSHFSRIELGSQRQRLREFVKTDDPPWTDKVISPKQFMRSKDGRVILGLDHPGPELQESSRRGIMDRIVKVDFRKEGPRSVQVRMKSEVLEEERGSDSKL